MIFHNLPWTKIPGNFSHMDVYRMAVAAAAPSLLSHMVEIGPGLGRSTAYFVTLVRHHNKPIILDAIDIWKGRRPVFLRNLEATGLLPYVNPIEMDSTEAAELYSDNTLNMVYLDGSDLYDKVLLDLAMWLPKVKQGGILAGAGQVDRPGVQQATSEFFRNKNILVRGNSFVHIKM